jgi:uncharacterized damage-inducible protein DinB
MSVLSLIRSYYEYNEWANNHVLDVASSLSDEELRREQGASFASVRGNLSHIAGAQIVWLGRWTGERSPALALLVEDASIEDIRRAFDTSHKDLREYITSLSEGALDATSSLEELARYRDRDGNNQQATLWKLMLQVVNHGTQHRSEAAMVLTSLGHPLRDLDYVLFELERQ